jgi:ubiquinone/menaquinone biosynthesis C-methylase UbiE
MVTRGAQGIVGKAFFYCRTPMILLDGVGVVVEINAACRELLGMDAGGCKGRHFSFLDERFQAHADGSLFPPEGTACARSRDARSDRETAPLVLKTEQLAVAVSYVHYDSDRFGALSIRTSELPCVETISGRCVGSAVSFEVIKVSDIEAFHQALDLRMRHEIMWEVYAASYDRVLAKMPFYQEVLERHCEALKSQHIRSVLDVGAGTGMVTVHLLGLGKEVVAIDIGRAMLERLYHKTEEADAGHLTVVEDTAESMPSLKSEIFDGINILLALFDMQYPASALREAQRVLRPGGTIVITEPRAGFNVEQLMIAGEESLRAHGLLSELAEDWKRIQSVAPLIQDKIRYTQTHALATHSGEGWHAEGILELLRLDGYQSLEFRESHFGNCATIIGIKP